MAIAAHPFAPSLSFALRGLAWGLGLFGLLRLPWIEMHAVLPLTRAQGRAAVLLSGAPVVPVDVTLACSGTDVLAMCVGVILAYPASWGLRAAGATGGVALILALNILRIGTLGRAAASPQLFDVLHLYVWPAVLVLATAGYVFAWMRRADTATRAADAPVAGPTRRFVLLTGAFVLLFVGLSPLYLHSAWLLSIATVLAQAAAGLLVAMGVTAVASGNILFTGRGGFVVTQECISTPLIPVYLAAVFAFVGPWRRRVPALLAVVPLFMLLGIARLLVVALPAAVIGSPLFLVHAFFQLLTGVVVVTAAAFWRHGAVNGWRWAGLAVAAGAACLSALSSLLLRVLWRGPAFEDPQGAIMLLPAFQIALFAALWTAVFAPARWRALAMGVAVLVLSQAVLFAGLHALDGFRTLAAHVPAVRAWSLALPLALTAVIAMYDTRRGLKPRTSPPSILMTDAK